MTFDVFDVEGRSRVERVSSIVMRASQSETSILLVNDARAYIVSGSALSSR